MTDIFFCHVTEQLTISLGLYGWPFIFSTSLVRDATGVSDISLLIHEYCKKEDVNPEIHAPTWAASNVLVVDAIS